MERKFENEGKNLFSSKEEEIEFLLEEEKEALNEKELEQFKTKLMKELEDESDGNYYEKTEMRKFEREETLKFEYLQGFKTDKEKLSAEQILKSNVRKFFMTNPILKVRYGDVDSLENQIRLELLEKANKGQIFGTYGFFKTVVMNLIRDHLRKEDVHCGFEDKFFDMDQKSSINHEESGENRLYKESEFGREAMRMDAPGEDMEFEQLFDSLLNENNYKDIKPARVKDEDIKKFIIIKAYHAGINDINVIKSYKKYEDELDEENKELIAKCVAEKGNITSDVMLKTFFGIRTGINAGSAGRITRGIPAIIEEMMKRKFPGYLSNEID